MYLVRAATGQVEVEVAPKVIVQPWRKGSVFEALREMWTAVGVIVISDAHRVEVGSNECLVGEHSSLARRKP